MDIVISDYIEKNIISGDKKQVTCLLPYNTILKRDYIEQQILRRYFIGNGVGLSALWNKIYKKDIIKLHSIKFDEKRTHGEDWKFNINYFMLSDSAIALSTKVYTYILNGTQSYNKYGRQMGYCLIEGHEIEKKLNELYSFVHISSAEYRKFMSRFLFQSLDYLKTAQFSKEDKKQFLRSPAEQELYRYLLRMSLVELETIGYSRKSLVGFFMLKIGCVQLGLHILDV